MRKVLNKGRKPSVTDEDISLTLADFVEANKKLPTVRELRDLMGGSGSPNRFSEAIKRWKDLNDLPEEAVKDESTEAERKALQSDRFLERDIFLALRPIILRAAKLLQSTETAQVQAELEQAKKRNRELQMSLDESRRREKILESVIGNLQDQLEAMKSKQ